MSPLTTEDEIRAKDRLQKYLEEYTEGFIEGFMEKFMEVYIEGRRKVCEKCIAIGEERGFDMTRERIELKCLETLEKMTTPRMMTRDEVLDRLGVFA